MATVESPTRSYRLLGMPRRPGVLASAAALSVFTLAAGGALTAAGIGPWYRSLEIPPFQPPAWVFTPAWTIIFVLVAFSGWRVSLHGKLSNAVVSLYAVQLVLNVLWSLFFFVMERPDLALVDAIALDAVVIAMVFVYGRADKLAGWFLVPYAGWMLFATAINAWIVANN
ncbi:MAG: TspO/MBR family protein [Planctomycetota bacterium]